VDGGHEGSEEGALLKLGKLEDDDMGWPERLGGADDEVEVLVDGEDEGSKEGALLKLAKLEDDDEG